MLLYSGCLLHSHFSNTLVSSLLGLAHRHSAFFGGSNGSLVRANGRLLATYGGCFNTVSLINDLLHSDSLVESFKGIYALQFLELSRRILVQELVN